MNSPAQDVDSYIAAYPEATQVVLITVRGIIKKAAPGAVESISYAIPAYKLNNRPIIYFAGYAKHIGIYATPSGQAAFSEELSKYKQGKGSVQFPLNNPNQPDQPIPYDLIRRMVEFNVSNVS